MNRDELRALRDRERAKLAAIEAAGKTTKIIVGMGTCGIAAGARETWEEIRKSVAEFGIEAEVKMSQTGCMGLCHVEPTVEVAVPGMPRVIYGKMNAEAAKRLVRKHVIEKTLLDGHILDRPAVDMIAERIATRGGK
jgi:NADP-reducing hydrogenase subunit HndB